MCVDFAREKKSIKIILFLVEECVRIEKEVKKDSKSGCEISVVSWWTWFFPWLGNGADKD